MTALEAPQNEKERASGLPVDLESLRIDRAKGTYRGARRGPSLFRRLLVTLLLLGLGAGGAYFYLQHYGHMTTGGSAPAVEVARVRLVSQSARARAAGFSAAGWVKLPRYHPVVVTPLVEGRLEEVLVIEGDRVKEGQELARIYAKDYEAELEAAEAAVQAACAECEKMSAGYRTQEVAEARSEMDRLAAQLEQARSEWERSKKLEPSGAIPLEQVQRDATRVETLEADLEKARLRVELLDEGYRKEDVALALAGRAKAEAERDLAKLRLGYTSIRSPMSGVVLERLGHRGQWVTPQDGVIASLYDPTDLEVRVDVNQNDLPKVHAGQTVEITSRAEPQRKYAGEVFLIEPKADLIKNTLPVRVKIEAADDHLLHPDMVVAVRFLPKGETVDPEAPPEDPATQARPDVVVPEAAVLRDGDETYVFVLKDETVHRAAIRLGDLVESGFVVESGLKGGEMVVTTGQARIGDGATVRVVE